MQKSNSKGIQKNVSPQIKNRIGSQMPTYKSGREGISFFKNFLQLLLVMALILVVFKGNEGYSWVWTDLIHENLKFINKNRNMSLSQKYQSKFGVDAAVLDYIKNKTPENAVILFPPYQVIMSDSSGYKFLKGVGGLKSRVWSTYFLYPRKLVYMEEYEGSKYKQQITHVVCMGRWGYDRLTYVPQERKSLDVFPLKKDGDNEPLKSMF